MTPQAVTESSGRRAAERLTAHTGLVFPRSRWAGLRRALATASAEAGFEGVDRYIDELDHQPRLLDRLVSLVTIGETYFFRHVEQLDVVSRRIVPTLIDDCRPGSDRKIRVWSAGCSTGEEAYTLAILVDEILRNHPDWDHRVVGTDIDRSALRQARTASYGRWSFRSDLGERADRFEEDGARRRVRASLVEHVSFSQDNLSAEGAGAPRGLGGLADLIFCRNVTMYLSDEARRRVAARFLDVLAPGGWLVLAPVELSSRVYSAFEAVVLDGLTFYRKPTRPLDPLANARHAPPLPRSRTVARVAAPAARVAAPAARGAAPAARVAALAAPAGEAPRPPKREAADRIASTYRLADQGRLGDARAQAELAVRDHPQDPRGYLLLASIADAQDDLGAAVSALRRVVYLDRADAAAQFQLGLLDWRMGQRRQGRARIATAVALLADRADHETLDARSELTVGRVRNTAELLAGG